MKIISFHVIIMYFKPTRDGFHFSTIGFDSSTQHQIRRYRYRINLMDLFPPLNNL